MKGFTWTAPEYVHTEKRSDWYWTVGIVVAAFAITSIIFHNILFAIVIMIGMFSLCIFSMRRPRVIEIHVTDIAVVIDKTMFPLSTLESFGINEEHHHGPHLHLKSKKVIMPLITIPVHHDDVNDLREFLKRKLKEEHFEQHLAHNILDHLGF